MSVRRVSEQHRENTESLKVRLVIRFPNGRKDEDTCQERRLTFGGK